MLVKLEYIWLDGYSPDQNLRSKTKIWNFNPTQTTKFNVLRDNGPCPDELPIWSFDGSSTKQAEGNFSDCLLKPVRVISDPQRKQAFLVMCEVLNTDKTPHESNNRHLIPIKDEEISVEDFNVEWEEEFWFGFEQEYTLIKDGKPLGFPKEYPAVNPNPQGLYYCSVGIRNVNGRIIAEEHLDTCLSAGLKVIGINAEVLLGQWEYQLFGKGAKQASDDLWLSRYFLLKDRHIEFINDYGSSNELRLTGKFETADINTFSYGVSDRGASIRIPIGVVNDGWKGYMEDRRPASNADPYKITKLLSEILIEEIKLVH